MNVLIAPDKFKGTLTAQQVCNSVADGIRVNHSAWPIVKAPLADGGDGTCDVLTSISGGNLVKVKVRDPFFRPIETYYGVSSDGTTAFVEMAKASGLELLKSEERNPGRASSVGTGDLIADALRKGTRRIIVGCGGSATNDAGIGMASALGVSFWNSKAKELQPIGNNLSHVESIKWDTLMSEVVDTKFILLSDVDNPLTGPQGAAYVYARQKGASDDDIIALDNGLKKFAEVLDSYFPGVSSFSGAGAAGGLPISMRAFLKAEIKSGIEFIIEYSKIEEKVRAADLVITGEGKLDSQSLQGKVISGVARICRQHNKQLWVVCGVNELSPDEWRSEGIEKVIAISEASSLKESIQNPEPLIQKEIEHSLSNA